ncbi:Nucleolar protein 12 [Entomortierella beljakovae]|nr:Nucleolar protein 12 [Entomortierella beljakovae]
MSLTASLLKGKAVDSSLESLFKNSAGPVVKSAPIPAKVRQPFPEDLPEQPKKKVKTPKPKSTPVSKKNKTSTKESDDELMDIDDDDEDEEEEDSKQDTKKNKKNKSNVESKYEAKVAAATSKDTKKARNAPKETQELISQQNKHEYGEGVDEEESKIEDLVHESLRKDNKRKASTTDGAETKSKKSKSAKSSAEAEDDSDDDDAPETNKGSAKKNDPEREARTAFVGNLAVSSIAQADYRKLKAAFKEFGTIESIRFRSVAFSELLPRKIAFITGKLHPERDVVNAYIVFKNKDSVAKAVKSMNGKLFLNKHIRVDTVDGAKQHQPKKSVFVGNLAFDAQEEDLWNFFKDSGDVENVRIIRDRRTNLGKGFAYVQFQDRASVDVALRLHETKLGTRSLRVVRCKRLEEEDNKTNGMGGRSSAGVNKSGKDAITKGSKPVKGQHAPIVMDGATKRLAFKSRKASEKHILSKKKSGAIVEGERSLKGAKVDLGIKKGKAKVKANVPKKKVVKK